MSLDVVTNGANSDAAIINQCQLHEYIVTNQLGFIEPEQIVPGDSTLPYIFWGDNVFTLNTWLMKPCSRQNMNIPERVFNYRLSQAFKVVEKAFCILAILLKVL